MLLSAGCTAAPTPDAQEVEALARTYAAKTVEVLGTRLAECRAAAAATCPPDSSSEKTPPTATHKPSPSPEALTATPVVIQPPLSACDKATFIADITIPDGVKIPPGTKFKKIWAVRNDGSCNWDANYALVYNGGEQMGGPQSLPLPDSFVVPGEMVLVSVDLVAPSDQKTYQSFWGLRNSSGQLFGVGEDGKRSLFVQITVANSYSFIDNLCSATWQNADGLLYCPMKDKDEKGYAVVIHNPVYENGLMGNRPTLVMAPQAIQDGEIAGSFAPVIVPPGAHLSTSVGCMYGYPNCKVKMGVRYSIEGGIEQVLEEWEEYYDGFTTNVDIDLGRLGLDGKPVAFTFYVKAHGGPEDQVFWVNPELTPGE